ncbi:hypothetical protein [Microbacterium sp. P04]|uniref:hypothetical protein n=1 Tax=Microbacterium sp. P04 TaxID=3366947 RepID=UPI003746A927
MASTRGKKRQRRRKSAVTRPPRTATVTPPISPGRRQPGERVFRFSDRFIKRTTITLLVSIPVLFLIGLAVSVITYTAVQDAGGDPGEALGPTIGFWIMMGAIILPLAIAAGLGGEALVRGGFLVGLTLVSGIAVVAISPAVDQAWLQPWGYAVMALGVVLFFVIGFIRYVPMWIGLPFARPGRVVSDGVLPGESEPGRLASAADRVDGSRRGPGKP